MKKALLSLSLLAFAAAATVSVQSCDKIKDEVKDKAGVDIDFDYTGGSATFDIPVITTLNATTYPDTVEVPLELTQAIDSVKNATGFDLGSIKSIKVTECELVINNADANNDASNFQTALAVMYTDQMSSPAVISSNDEVPDAAGSTSIILVPKDVDLKDYMSAGTKVYYIAGVNMRKATTKVLNCTMKVKYNIQF